MGASSIRAIVPTIPPGRSRSPPKMRAKLAKAEIAPAMVAVTVMVRVSRFFTCASSCAMTARTSSRVSKSSRPVVAQTAAFFGSRPVAKAFGWSEGMIATFGRGRPAPAAISSTSST